MEKISKEAFRTEIKKLLREHFDGIGINNIIEGLSHAFDTYNLEDVVNAPVINVNYTIHIKGSVLKALLKDETTN